MADIGWKIGVEIELLAPRGSSRETLARRVAERIGGTATRIFHPESELSAVPGQPIFANLTLGYRVDDPQGNWAASFVDDLTLQADLDKGRAPQPGWYRIVADDMRFLRLAGRHCDAEQPLDAVLAPFSALFGTEPEAHPGGMYRVQDPSGASLAIGAPLPGERERPCEIVTAPMDRDQAEILEALLDDARALGFVAPKEGATHIHFDAAPLKSASFVARFVRLMRLHRDGLRKLVGVNPNCIRLGDWPLELDRLVFSQTFADADWTTAKAALSEIELTKYCDFNLCNMLSESEEKQTLEVRILPTMFDGEEIALVAALFAGILRLALDEEGPIPETMVGVLASPYFLSETSEYWKLRLSNL